VIKVVPLPNGLRVQAEAMQSYDTSSVLKFLVLSAEFFFRATIEKGLVGNFIRLIR
jgi:hypothetical protein